MPFNFNHLDIPGLCVIEPKAFPDERGFFMEAFKASDFAAAGINGPFVQDNHSCSLRGSLRGLHFQREPHAQGKLIRVSRGRVWDVAVDLRTGSQSFGRWHGLELSADNRLMFWIPAGFAHGFLALEDGSELQYKCTVEYHSPSDAGIRWDSPELSIQWPILDINPILSPKDAALPLFDPATRYFSESL